MTKKIAITLALYLILSSGLVSAGVFRCLGKQGVYEFQDRVCDSTKQETFLPYTYNATDLSSQEGARRTGTHFSTQKKEEQKKQKILIRTQKRLEKEALKAKRLQARCKRTQEKIQIAEQRLRLGCKALHCIRLKEQIAHDQAMKQRYCTLQTIQ